MITETSNENDIRFLQVRWRKLLDQLTKQFGKEPDIEAMLFLIGLRELGRGPGKYTKEQKLDLMHIAICAILAPSGYYELSHLDQDGWPHWDSLKPLPFIDIFSQELFLKSHIVDYFAEIYEI
ncbi:MAG TPA: hypothetical protein ENJ82_03635 [Bacteroidetes bacterium]|nr:hypothetical protein [Bacteroidota bacterium]